MQPKVTRNSNNRQWTNNSQQTPNHVKITLLDQRTHHSKAALVNTRVIPIPIQRVSAHNPRVSHRYYGEEYFINDKQRDAQTGRWVLNVITAHEEYQKAMKIQKNYTQPTIIQASTAKKASFQSFKSSRIEPFVNSTSQLKDNPFYQSQIEHEVSLHNPQRRLLSPTTIDDVQSEILSDFSSAASVDHDHSQKRKRNSSNDRSDHSTDDFHNSDEKFPCFTKRVIIACTILSVLLIIGIVVAVFVTIFVARGQSSSSESKSLDSKMLSIQDKNICSSILFNLTDLQCQGQNSYNYFSCYQMPTSSSMTIRFEFQGHWYIDDVNIVQNSTDISLIINGDFESNLTNWIVNSSEIYVDRNPNLAHTGSAYLVGRSQDQLNSIEQTFHVQFDQWIEISFWWKYDAESNQTNDNLCQAIGQLI